MENSTDKSQSDKFKDLAREVGADENETAFDAKLRWMREQKPEEQQSNE